MAEVTNYIDRLVAELCPDGVDFYTIDELITLDFGTRITKSKDAGTIYPVYGGGGASFRTDNYNREDKYVVSRFAMSEKCVRYVSGKFWMLDSGFTYSVKDESLLSYKYISYWLLNAQQEIYACSSQSAQRNLKTAEFKRFEVPVPPMEIQEAIVEILDKFTNLEAELEANLEAELEARTLQHEYYRGALFDSLKDTDTGLPAIAGLVKALCPDGVDFYTIDELITLDFGTRITKSKDAGTIYPVYGGGGASFRTDNYNREDKYVVSRFAMSEKCVRYVSGKFWMLDSGFTYSVKDESLLSYKYISYWLLNAQQEIYACSSQSAQRNLKTAEFKRFEVPVPPMEIQEAIVDILDCFDALTTSLFEGLPAELAARRSQYEYYRDQLLTFPRKGENQ